MIIKEKEMKSVKDRISELASTYFDEMQQIRRHFHKHPELSMEEVATSAYICRKLDDFGIPYQAGIAKTGVVGLIRGKKSGTRCIALRADMDALPVTEENKTSYISTIPGKMHACGHDAHMACLLGAAKILTTLKEEFGGCVKLIFQPSEETYPGGAIQMIEAGILKNPDVDHVIGLHVFPLLEAGKTGFRPGPYMASTDEVFLTVKGQGGHAASPNLAVDPILIASHIVIALQQIVSRNANPVIPTVVSFGRIIGEGRTNIIPDEVRLDGTIRTYNEEWRKEIHRRIQTIASSIAVSMGGSCEVRIAHGYPGVENDEKLTRSLAAFAAEYLGENNVVSLDQKMTAEDFAYYGRQVPSCFFRLGIRNEEKGIIANLHSSSFDIDEKALETGAGTMAWLAWNLLSE